MSRFATLCQSSIGAKLAMAVTGILLFVFVVAHLLGNLLVFAGREATNAYAHGLREMGGLLWAARVGLVAVFLVHVASALRLWRLNRAARPEPYAVVSPVASSYAGRTIVMTGLLVLLYVVYHLLHFTLGVTNPEFLKLVDPKGRPDVYLMVVRGFSNVAISAVYLAAMVLLGLHLSHGVTSLFQTLGISHPSYDPLIKRLGPVSAILIFAGYASIPVAVVAGLLKAP